MNKQEEKNYRFFSHKDCEFFPCHKGLETESFNCLFCYCPLYTLGSKCGGDFRYGDNGIKDCSDCLIPHSPDGFDYIIEHFQLIIENMKNL